MAPRVALIGLRFTSNRRAPVVRARDLGSGWLASGAAVLNAARAAGPTGADPLAAFVAAMDATGPWQPLPVLAAGMPPAGPLYDDIADDLFARSLRAVAEMHPVDAIFLTLGGAWATPSEPDMNGKLLEGLREVAGPKVQLYATLAAAADVSDRMAAAADVLLPAESRQVATQAEQAAVLLRFARSGRLAPATAAVRLPLLWPRTTIAGERLAALRAMGVRRLALAPEIAAAAIVGGLPHADGPGTGLTVVVTARRAAADAEAVAREIAAEVWSQRQGCEAPLASIAAAIATAVGGQGPRTLLLDAGDAIEEGAAGQSTELLSALAWRGAAQCLSAFHVDPVLVERARNAGVGATIAAVFNSAPGGAVTAGRLEAEAVVGAVAEALPPGEPPFDHSGPACALQIGGVTVAVVSRRYLVRDPAAFGALDIDIAALQTVVLKGRLASLDPAVRLALPPAVHDVDVPGATSPGGAPGLDFGRPVYPLNKDVSWPPE